MNEAMKKYPPRPIINDAIREEAAKIWIEEYGSEYTSYEKEYLHEVLSNCNLSDDGYEIGKLVEEDTCLTVDFQLCEALNYFNNILYASWRKAMWAWVKDNQIVPPYPVGTRVRYSVREIIIIGVITKISETSPAIYLIKDVKDENQSSNNGCWEVYFEDVEKISDEKEDKL